MTDARSTLRALLWPVYAPSFIYAAGIAALLPAQVLLALELGFTAAQVAFLATSVGGFAIGASFAAGYVVQWLGEQRALLVSSGGCVAMLLATWAGAAADHGTARVLLVVALLAVDMADAVWSIARQGLVADLAPVEHRGRAMNVYGASQRLGRVVGPFVAAAVLAVTGPAAVLPVTSVVVAVAYLVLAHQLRVGVDARTATAAAQVPSGVADPMRALLVLGLGILALAAVRTAKETLVPLWGADGLGLAGATVALVTGVASMMELLLFWPAGIALDRAGRGPVAAACLTLMGIGLVLMPASHATGWFLATAMLVGLGDGVGAGIVKTLGIDLAPAEQRGRFLGWWQTIASVGSFVAPAMAGAVISVASLAAVLPAIGVLGLAGAAWMAWWTPTFVPRRRPVSG